MKILRYAVSALIAIFLVFGTAQAKERNFHVKIVVPKEELQELVLGIGGRGEKKGKKITEFGARMLPSNLTVNEGDTVRIKVTNEASINEGFTIGAFNIRMVLEPGETRTVSFVADKAGAFVIQCQLHPDILHAPGSLNVL